MADLVKQTGTLTKMWNIPKGTMAQVDNCMQIYNSTHGMFAGVPIICKADKCHYLETCLIDPAYRIKGTRCPMEAGAVISRFEHWCTHFGIDVSNGTLRPDDAVDAMLVRDLVDNEVQMLRADNRIAISGDFLGKTISSVDNKGNEHLEDTITPAEEFKFKLQEKRHKILQLLNSTRKDKANQITGDQPSTKAATLLNKVNQLINQDELDNVEFVETEYESINEEVIDTNDIPMEEPIEEVEEVNNHVDLNSIDLDQVDLDDIEL